MARDFMGFLLRTPASRRVFGKRELKIIEKQLRGVDLTQSEKNRLSRDVRAKLGFIEQAARFSGDFRLRKGALVQEAVVEAVEAVRRDGMFPLVERIWLFGSAATGGRSLESDVDLAVELSPAGLRNAAGFRARVSGGLPADVDLQVFNTLPGKIRKEVLATGKLLYERKDKG